VQCALREVRDEDLAVLFDQWPDPVAARMAAFTAPDHMDRDAFDRRWSRLRADETTINRAIVVEGEVAGTIGSWGDPDEREVTYWIGRSYWGKGIATCALDAFLTVDPSRPLHARVAYDNVASRRVLEKCGFRVIATERSFAEARSREIEEACCGSTMRRSSAPQVPKVLWAELEIGSSGRGFIRTPQTRRTEPPRAVRPPRARSPLAASPLPSGGRRGR
jgi:RimJ/RimL family protein N-acetyltransferase